MMMQLPSLAQCSTGSAQHHCIAPSLQLGAGVGSRVGLPSSQPATPYLEKPVEAVTAGGSVRCQIL